MENLWFLSGARHIKFLKKHGCNFWSPWADKDDYVPSPYGFYWRNFPGDMVDQIRWVLWELKRNPNSRRLVVSAWDPANARKSALPPCHFAFVFNVQYKDSEPHLNLHLTQRSCDAPVGLPYNIAGYAFLLELFAKFSGMKAGIFAHSLVDAHIYENQMKPIKEQISREPRKLPKLVIGDSIQGLSDIDELIDQDLSTAEIMSYFDMQNYDPYPAIKFEVAV